MRCIRCQAEDTEDAKFCRACGFPAAFGDFIACAVCGGEVHTDVKICPGCHHKFALAMPLQQGVRVRRRNLYLPTIAAFALTGFAYIYSVSKTDFVEVAATGEVSVVEVEDGSGLNSAALLVEGRDDSTPLAVKVSNSTAETAVSNPRAKVHVMYFDLGRLEAQSAKPVAPKHTRKKVIVAAAKLSELSESRAAEPSEAEHLALAAEEKFEPRSSNYFAREIERWHFCQGKWNSISDCPHYPDHKPNW